MSSPIISVEPDYTVSDVARFMDDRHIRRVIIMKKDLILGAVTAKDFVRVIVTEGDKDVQFFRAMMRASASRY
jgi:predicted transcriptional regulator